MKWSNASVRDTLDLTSTSALSLSQSKTVSICSAAVQRGAARRSSRREVVVQHQGGQVRVRARHELRGGGLPRVLQLHADKGLESGRVACLRP